MEQDSKTLQTAGINHRKLMFYVPMLYAYYSRYRIFSKYRPLVWVGDYLIPVLLIAFLSFESMFKLGDVGFFLLSIVCVYCLYEVGYIQNDCETIKHEFNPTIRLNADDLLFYEKHKFTIYFTRILITVVMSIYFCKLTDSILGITALWLILPYYFVYNTLRGRINSYLIAGLIYLRYIVPSLLLFPNMELWMLLLVFFIYPFPHMIQGALRGKYGTYEKWGYFFFSSYDKRVEFRVKYYAFLTFTCLLLSLFCRLFSPLYSLLPSYFLIYRGVFLVVKMMDKKKML